jgi:endonuclease-3
MAVVAQDGSASPAQRRRPDRRHLAERKHLSSRKRPFNIDLVMSRIRSAVRPFRKAAMFELAERGFDSVFQILAGCIISIRTLDEVSLPTAIKLFKAAPAPRDVAKLSVRQIDALIHACSFHAAKARQIRAIAAVAARDHGGELPCDRELLMRFGGVGPKCANLTVGVACRQPIGISVDVHVHRVTNRWGYVQAAAPEKTGAQLQAKLPKKYWIALNELLVPFGKHICTGRAPRCSTCPVLQYCRQVGVRSHR